jgi:hypothetical protein
MMDVPRGPTMLLRICCAIVDRPDLLVLEKSKRKLTHQNCFTNTRLVATLLLPDEKIWKIIGDRYMRKGCDGKKGLKVTATTTNETFFLALFLKLFVFRIPCLIFNLC